MGAGKSSENPTSSGAVGPIMLKHVVHFASEEGTSCQKPRILGAMGPIKKSHKFLGNFEPYKDDFWAFLSGGIATVAK